MLKLGKRVRPQQALGLDWRRLAWPPAPWAVPGGRAALFGRNRPAQPRQPRRPQGHAGKQRCERGL